MNTTPKYIQKKNRVCAQLPLSQSTETTDFNNDNNVHTFNLLSTDYKFQHRIYTADGAPLVTVNAIPVSIFQN